MYLIGTGVSARGRRLRTHPSNLTWIMPAKGVDPPPWQSAPFISAVEARKAAGAAARRRRSAPACRAWASPGVSPRPAARSPCSSAAKRAAARPGPRPACWRPASRPSPARNACSRSIWRASACGRLSATELEAASGVGVGYRDEGTLAVALTRDDVERLRFAFEFQRACGIELEWLSGVEARRLEPHLRPGLAAAVLSPNDHQVDSRRLVAGAEAGVPRGRRRAARACRGARPGRRRGTGARRGRRRRALRGRRGGARGRRLVGRARRPAGGGTAAGAAGQGPDAGAAHGPRSSRCSGTCCGRPRAIWCRRPTAG